MVLKEDYRCLHSLPHGEACTKVLRLEFKPKVELMTGNASSYGQTRRIEAGQRNSRENPFIAEAESRKKRDELVTEKNPIRSVTAWREIIGISDTFH